MADIGIHYTDRDKMAAEARRHEGPIDTPIDGIGRGLCNITVCGIVRTGEAVADGLAHWDRSIAAAGRGVDKIGDFATNLDEAPSRFLRFAGQVNDNFDRGVAAYRAMSGPDKLEFLTTIVGSGVLGAKGLPSGTAAEAQTELAGIVYRRTDLAGGKPYIGQSISDRRFIARQGEHARKNPGADFQFEIVGRAEPGRQLDLLEEYFIRAEGGPTNRANPAGLLANMRHQMSGVPPSGGI